MYAEAGLLFPYFQGMGFSNQEANHQHQLQEEELFRRLSINGLLDDHSNNSCGQGHLPIISAPTGKLMRTSSISEYDLGGEGDLFKAPEPIIEDPVIEFDPVTAAISMMSAGEDIITAEAIEVADIGSISSDQLLSDIFYECKRDLLAKSAIEEAILELSDIKIPDIKIQPLQVEEDHIMQKEMEGPMQKCVSASSLTSNECTTAGPLRPNFLGFQEMNFGAAFGMRRSYSEGDIETLGSGNSAIPHPPFQRLLSMDSYKIEERQEKLSRYRRKKTKRNFGRKIKYACRKALADSQPRVRGRFARTEECEVARPSK